MEDLKDRPTANLEVHRELMVRRIQEGEMNDEILRQFHAICRELQRRKDREAPET